jgi:outer membrane receptor for ferrienterochelin and colicins
MAVTSGHLQPQSKKIMRNFYAVLLTVVIAGTVSAQEDSTKAKNLEEIIITGQYRPQSVKNSVYNVRVINNERIRLSGATSIQQVLNNQLGFRFSNDNTLGTTDVQLLGMSGRNVKILLDGVPLVDRGDTRESLGQVDINTIDRIEIVEGPMSVSYGSDALAGVINIITKRPGNNSFSVTAKAQEETAGDEYHPFSYKGVHTQSLSLSWQQKNWSVIVGGNHNDFDGFGGDDYGRAKSWRPKEQWLGNTRIGYRNNKIDIYYRLDGLQEEIVSRGPINMSAYTAFDQYYKSKRYTHQLQNQWRISNRAQLATILSYTDYNRRTKTFLKDFVAGTSTPGTQPGQQDVSKFNSFVFRNTLNYQFSPKVSIQPGIDINHEEASGERIKGNPVINDYALFISSEFKPTSAINIRPGLRFIKNSVYDAPPVIPSINTKFALSKDWDFRAAYAYGFRSPALRELYFNFIDANHTIVGNPNLKAEHSNSFNGFLSWSPAKLKSIAFTSTLGGFYNVFDNLIDYASSPTSADTTITVNIAKFKTTGVTFENKMIWKDLNATLGFSYIGRYNSLSADDAFKDEDLPEFVWSPEINSNIIYTAKKIKTTFGLFYKFTGKRPGYTVAFNNNTGQDEVVLTKIDAFHWADFTVTKPLFSYFTVTGGVKNIFDVTTLTNTSAAGGAHSTGGPVPMSYGRSYFLGLSFQWNKK